MKGVFMAEEHTQQQSPRGKSRRERVEHARSRDILDVANELSMELVQSGRDYRWKEHDSMVISPEKNMWNWFSRHQGGDVIALVQTMKEVNFNQAIDFLNDGTFKEFTHVERVQEPFTYYLQPYEQPFEAARDYLKEQRGLSDETIDFFLEKGVLAQANAKVNGSIEPVVVFKSFDFSGEIVGATLQGSEENWEKWPERGYAKNIVRNSYGITGMHVDIGQPNRLIFAESAIDLMSYYELNKEKLQDVRLVSMDGLKESVVGRHLAQLQADISGRPLRWTHDQLAEGLQTAIDNNFFTDGKHANWITLAVDNDEGGRTFIDSLQKKGAAIISDLPELQAGQEKTDWNDYLQQVKKGAEKELVFTMDSDAIQEALSQEGDLVGSQISENQMVYTNRIDIGQDYQLSLTIYSPEAVDQLSDVAAHWTVEVLKDNQSLGYLAYGGDWGNEFHITEELKGLQEGIQSHQLERQLYTQKEIDGFLKQYDDVSKPDNSRLAQARRKLERLQNEASGAIDAVYEYGAQTNGQPMNDKRGGDRYFRRQDQLENRIFSKLDEVKKQEERVERLEHQQHLKELGLNRQGTGLEMSVQNIPRIREELEKADRGESFYTRETLKRYRSELERLEGIVDQVSSVTISPAAQSLIDDGLVTQWAKQPNIYFVKGLRRVAFELSDSGEFQLSKKYSPRTPEEVNKVEELLSRKDNLTQPLADTIIKAHGSAGERVYFADDGIVQRLEREYQMTPELSQKPQLEVIFDFSENRRIAEKYNQGDIIPYQEFVSDLYQENSLATFELGYFKTYFALQNEHGEILVESFRYDIGTEKELLSEQLSQALPAEYLQIAYDADLLVSGKEQEAVVVPEEKEKSLEMTQETISESRQQKNAEGTIGDFPDNNQEAAPLPEANQSQPLNDLSPNQTQPQPLLHFSINKDGQSINKRNYHAISDKDLVKLNRYAGTLQQAANWYLNELADSKIYYFYQENDSVQTLQVTFDKDKFQHLTGVFPYKEGQSAEQTLEDFANGNGAFDTILLANKGAAFDKLKVLPELPAIVESDSFYFGDLSEVPKLHSLDLDKAIKSGDEDIILALRTVDNTTFPASLMKLRTGLKNQLAQTAGENIILGVYRERDGQIDQLSINEEFVKDGGQEMLSILENKQYEEALEPSQEIVQSDTISAELFTQVLDAAYNVGDPRQLGTELPEESKAAWEHYYELSDGYDGNFTAVIAAADQQELVDKSSQFYQEWHQDRIYNETYHVRLQWSEIWPDGPQIPFKETELVEYQTFAEELYKQNRAFYDRHQESLATGNQADYVPFTKVKFDVYAPGGILIKDNILYDIGDETEPISRLLGLGYRRLEGQPELAAIDEKILSQLENQEVNQEIATEANEQSLKRQDILLDETNNPREHFQSPNQEMKVSLAQRLEEIMAEESVKNPVRENEQEHPVTSDEPFDYTSASAFEISEHAFQKIREYTQSPEDLMEYMDFMSKFPQLSPRNVALIHEQWSGANAVATYDQWQAMGETLGIKPDDVIQTKATYTNKRTGETKEIVHQGLSVKTGEKSKITLFRPVMAKMIPVLDEHGQQLKNDKGNPKYKKLSDATPQEKALVKDGKLSVRQFQERDPKTGYPRFTTYKVFELSQTTLKPESYPKAMPNRHFNFNTDKVKTKEVLEGLCDYAESIGVSIMKDEAHVLGNAKGAFFPGEQLILINPDNTPGEKIATTIHELAHATLHNPSLTDQYKELPKVQKELEAEMTSHLLSKHFGLDTTEKAIDYMAKWTDNLQGLNDKQLADSLKRIHKTVSKMHKQIEHHTKPYQQGKNRGQSPNFPKAPTKGPSH